MSHGCNKYYAARADRFDATGMCPKCGLKASRHPETWHCVADLCDMVKHGAQQVHERGRRRIIDGLRNLLAEHVEGSMTAGRGK